MWFSHYYELVSGLVLLWEAFDVPQCTFTFMDNERMGVSLSIIQCSTNFTNKLIHQVLVFVIYNKKHIKTRCSDLWMSIISNLQTFLRFKDSSSNMLEN